MSLVFLKKIYFGLVKWQQLYYIKKAKTCNDLIVFLDFYKEDYEICYLAVERILELNPNSIDWAEVLKIIGEDNRYRVLIEKAVDIVVPVKDKMGMASTLDYLRCKRKQYKQEKILIKQEINTEVEEKESQEKENFNINVKLKFSAEWEDILKGDKKKKKKK
jgi:hypothetical protein